MHCLRGEASDGARRVKSWPNACVVLVRSTAKNNGSCNFSFFAFEDLRSLTAKLSIYSGLSMRNLGFYKEKVS